MTHHHLFNVLRGTVLALAMLGAVGQAAAAVDAHPNQYHVVIDTTSLAGTGWFDLQLNPGLVSAPGAIATLSNFVGSLDNGQGAESSGDVAGSLPGTVQFGNSTAYNDLFHAVNFGSTFSFDIAFSGAFLNTTSNIGSSFGFAIYADDATTTLGNADAASGNVLQFNLLPAAGAGQYGYVSNTVYDAGLVSVSAVPEPSEWLLMASGIALLGFATRRRRAMAK
jgi:hypothetical protein